MDNVSLTSSASQTKLSDAKGAKPIVESGGTVCVLVADCQRPESRARLKPETMTFNFSPTHDFFDYKGCSALRVT
jgi:hypothetical protein